MELEYNFWGLGPSVHVGINENGFSFVFWVLKYWKWRFFLFSNYHSFGLLTFKPLSFLHVVLASPTKSGIVRGVAVFFSLFFSLKAMAQINETVSLIQIAKWCQPVSQLLAFLSKWRVKDFEWWWGWKIGFGRRLKS